MFGAESRLFVFEDDRRKVPMSNADGSAETSRLSRRDVLRTGVGAGMLGRTTLSHALPAESNDAFLVNPHYNGGIHLGFARLSGRSSCGRPQATKPNRVRRDDHVVFASTGDMARGA